MTDRFARERDFWRKLLLSATGLLSVAAPVLFNLLETGPVHAQATSENAKRDIADTWQGTLHTGRDLRTVVKISKADGGEYEAVFYSIDQSGDGLPVNKITLDGAKLKISIVAIAGAYDGKLSSDGKSIRGTWTQGSTVVPLTLTRATPETEWTIPPPT
jgi:hypothetical protein